MRTLIHIAVIFTALHQTFAYSKYGRSCKDIGCLSNEACVMAEDPCSYYNRDQCGSYPTCKPVGAKSSTCENYTCPPTQSCKIDHGEPKCFPSSSSSSDVHQTQNRQHSSQNQNPSYPAQNPSYPAQNPSYPAQNPSYPAQNPSYPSHNPSAPSYPGGGSNPSYPSGGLYPSLSTPRPQNAGGYPNYPGYPQQGAYPSQGGYPGYPSQGGYPQYPQGQYPGYNQGGYNNQGYNRQAGYGNQPSSGGSRYGSNSNSGSNPIVDKITDQLKTIGLFIVLVKCLTVRLLSL